MSLKSAFVRVVEAMPLASDLFAQHIAFRRRVAACRGVYRTFAEARAAAPRRTLVGYDQPVIHDAESVAQATARSDVGALNPRDYPVLFWLRPLLRGNSTVFNLGGNVGLEYYAYRAKLDFPAGLSWVVCEVPEVVRAGRELADTREAPGLAFTTRFEDANGSDVLLTCGTLQYIEDDLALLLRRLERRPPHVLVNRVPLYEGETFVTLQNLGYAVTPYRIQNRRELVDGMSDLGYRLADSWSDWRTMTVPFHPERFVSAYHGLYFETDG
jgi:putative methyltransferase (TIGR04325 family)